MIGIKLGMTKSVMENRDRDALSPSFLAFTPPIKNVVIPAQPGSTCRVYTVRSLATAYKAYASAC